MRAILYPSEISGRVAAPPSKSMAHRALICAALAKGESRVLNLSASQDITACCYRDGSNEEIPCCNQICSSRWRMYAFLE